LESSSGYFKGIRGFPRVSQEKFLGLPGKKGGGFPGHRDLRDLPKIKFLKPKKHTLNLPVFFKGSYILKAPFFGTDSKIWENPVWGFHLANRKGATF